MACRPPTGYWRQVVVNHTRRHHRGAIPTVNLTPKGVYRHETVYTKQGLFKVAQLRERCPMPTPMIPTKAGVWILAQGLPLPGGRQMQQAGRNNDVRFYRK